MTKDVRKNLDAFVPDWYYEEWAEQTGVSLSKYPYCLMEHDPSVERRVPFAIVNFYIPTVDEQKVAAAVLVYKSTFSKTQFRRLIYL